MTAARPLRLVAIPPRHAYVDAVRPAGVQPVRPGRVTGFEPDPLFVPGAWTGLSAEADLVHLHFGFDTLTAAQARAWTVELDAAGLPLVLTVHDLRNPHHEQRDQHDAVLAELIPAAAAVITLTHGAAAEIAERFGRTAVVLAHPGLVDAARTADVVTEPGLVLLHLKSLRRNLRDPDRLARAAARGAQRAGGRLRVDLHPELVDDPRVTALAGLSGIEVVVHPRFDDLELERYLRRAQVSVLPHRWGTHSGWLELARDLGTRIVAGTGGYYAEQWTDVISYRHDERHGLDEDSLADAVTRAVEAPEVTPADAVERAAEAERIRAAHAELYAQVLALAAAAPR